jgi:hypothetical protein
MAATAAPSQHVPSFARASVGFLSSTAIMAAVMVLMAAL